MQHHDNLEKMLDGFMDIMLSITWLNIKQKGGVFIVKGDEKILTLVSSKYLGEELKTQCKNVDFGKCLCGRAAEQKKDITFFMC